MTALMVKMGDGFYIPKLDGFDDIKKDTISVNIDLSEDESNYLSYKELKGIAIMEKYYEKLKNDIDVTPNLSEAHIKFRKMHNIGIDLEEYLKAT